VFQLYYPLASEWKSFLLYYIPVALHGILPMKYFLHVFLLIKALRIVLSETIEKNKLKLADRLFSKFCSLMEIYYGENYNISTILLCLYHGGCVCELSHNYVHGICSRICGAITHANIITGFIISKCLTNIAVTVCLLMHGS